MNLSQASKLRKDYQQNMHVDNICSKYRIASTSAYEIIANQRFYDKNYEPPLKPKYFLDEYVGMYKVNQLRGDGKSWRTISKLIEKEYGVHVKANTIRRWFNTN